MPFIGIIIFTIKKKKNKGTHRHIVEFQTLQLCPVVNRDAIVSWLEELKRNKQMKEERKKETNIRHNQIE